MNENAVSNVMEWDDAIENDGAEFKVLPEGDYLFRVTDYERGRFPGSAKIEPCNKATVFAKVQYEGGQVPIRFDLILNRILEWRISAFFRAIGMKKHGERVILDWNKVPGSYGKCHIRPRKYQDKDGNEHEINDVVSFYDFNPEEWKEPSWLTDARTAEELPFELP